MCKQQMQQKRTKVNSFWASVHLFPEKSSNFLR